MANHDYISTTDGKAIVPDLCTETVGVWNDEPEPCLREQPCPVHDFLRRESERNERAMKSVVDVMDRVFNLAAGREPKQ